MNAVPFFLELIENQMRALNETQWPTVKGILGLVSTHNLEFFGCISRLVSCSLNFLYLLYLYLYFQILNLTKKQDNRACLREKGVVHTLARYHTSKNPKTLKS